MFAETIVASARLSKHYIKATPAWVLKPSKKHISENVRITWIMLANICIFSHKKAAS